MIGTRLAERYEIQRELGRGGMGVVYLAYDPLLDRQIAVKLLTPGTFNKEAEERLKREARTIAKMDHHGVVVIYDVGSHNDSMFFVMPYVRGDNLRTLMKENKLSLTDVLDLGIQTAEALEYSHIQGVIHRDIKPENIMVTRSEDGQVHARITDFGLAIVSTDQRVTESGLLVGTIAYFSPEQITQQTIDQRSDIYSLATVLYECVTGRVPFTGELQSVLYSILHEFPQRPGELGITIDPDLEAILLQALQKEPKDRPQRSKDFAQMLRGYRSHIVDQEGPFAARHPAVSIPHEKQPLPLVGRERELSELQRRLNTSLSGECQFVVFGGEAGIGKTRLLEQLERLAKAKKIRVLQGRFVEQDRVFPYQGFCEMVQEFFRSGTLQTPVPVDFSDLAADLIRLFPVLGEIAEMKSTSAGVLISADTEVKKPEDRIQIFELLAKTIARIGGGQPLILFLEELHSADISLDALQYIVRRLGPTSTLIVGTYRSTEVHKGDALTRMLETFQGDRRFSTFVLQPFDREEHREFLEILIGSGKFETQIAERLYQATEGNPYFTKELVRSMMDAGQMVQSAGNGVWTISVETAISSQALPVTIQQTIEKRIDRLPAELRNILSVASVPGRSFDLVDLEFLLETTESSEEALEKLIDLGFLEEQNVARGERFSFSSGVLRDVLYGALSRRRRKALNLKFAQALEAKYARKLDRVYPRLLHHFVEADISEKVVEYGLKLARKSLETFSAEEALRSARIVLEFLEDEERSLTEAEARKMMASSIRLTGNFDGALKEFAKAIDIYQKQDQGKEMMDTILLAAETAWEGRSIEATIQWIEIGLGLSRRIHANESLIKLLSLATTVTNLRGEHQKAKEYLNEINSLQPALPEKDEQVTTGGTLTVAFPASIEARHPAQMVFDEEEEVLTNVFETLLSRDAKGHLIPHLCERWETLNSGQSFVITLRTNIRLHDGQSLTAADVKHSFEQAIKFSSRNLPAAYSALRGVPDFLNGICDEVYGITALSEHQLQLQLNQPLAMYGSMLTDGRTAVVKQVQDKYIGTGPFVMKSFGAREIILQKNPDYWKGPSPLLDFIEFKNGIGSAQTAAGFRTGAYDLARDLAPNDLEEILRNRSVKTQLVEVAKKNTYFALFNQNSAALIDIRVRQALSGVIRTHDLIRRALGRFAQPAEGLLPPGILGHDPGRRRRPISREQSLELLKQARVPSGLVLRASIHPILQDRYGLLTQSILQIWKEIGIEVVIETPTMTEFQDRRENNEGIDLMIGRWIADYDDPDNFAYGLFDSEAGRFRKYLSSADLDELISHARSEMHPVARERFYSKIENLLHESAMLVPLFHDIDYRLANPKIHAIKLYSNPPYLNYSEIWKSEPSPVATIQRARGGTIHVPASQEMNSLDPALVFRLIEFEALPAIFETLMKETQGLHVTPWLASEFQAEAGGKRYKFRLRDDVRFHDGRKLTARDVRYSFERLLQNPASENRWLLSCISGAQELLKSEVGDLKGFRILSASEFVIELDQVLSFFPTLLAHPLTSILPEGSETFTGRPAGTGPFRVLNFDPGRRLELEANPDYWRKGFPKCDRLIFTFDVSISDILSGFRSGQFSLAWNLFPSDVEALRHESESGVKYKEIPRLSTYYFAFNIHKGPFQDEQLRHELIRSLDTESMVRKTVGRLAILAESLIPPGLLGYEKGLRRRAHHPSTRLVKDLEVTCFLNSVYQGPYSGFADDFSRAMREKGFQMKFVDTKSEYHINQASTLARADCNLTRWISDYPDADSFVFLLHTEKGFIGKLCGLPEIDQLIERGRTEMDSSTRHNIYREIEEIVERKALLIPLFHEQSYCFARPDIEDFEINLFSPVVAYEKLWKFRG